MTRSRLFNSLVMGLLATCIGFMSASTTSATETIQPESRLTSGAPALDNDSADDETAEPLGPHEGVTRYHCYFAGGTAVELDIRLCPNASVNIVRDGNIVGKVSTDSNGKPYVGSDPNWYCVASVASGVITLFTAAGTPVGWVAAGSILNAIGIYSSCRQG